MVTVVDSGTCLARLSAWPVGLAPPTPIRELALEAPKKPPGHGCHFCPFCSTSPPHASRKTANWLGSARRIIEEHLPPAYRHLSFVLFLHNPMPSTAFIKAEVDDYGQICRAQAGRSNVVYPLAEGSWRDHLLRAVVHTRQSVSLLKSHKGPFDRGHGVGPWAGVPLRSAPHLDGPFPYSL